MTAWLKCLELLRSEVTAKQYELWLRPIQAIEEKGCMILLMPNNFVLEYITENLLDKIEQIINSDRDIPYKIVLKVGSYPINEAPKVITSEKSKPEIKHTDYKRRNLLNANFTFANFVEGKSNQLARAAALQVANNLGKAYNPFFIYGGVGLGKTHLMHAIGNAILAKHPEAQVLYLRSERFVAEMVKALQP